MVRLSILILTLLAVAGCTRPAPQTKTRISLTLPAQKNTQQGGNLSPIHVVINVTGSGLARTFYSWDLCQTCSPSEVPSSHSLEVQQGAGRLVQVLAVYKDNTTGLAKFFYGDVTQDLTKSEVDVPVNVTDISEGLPLISGQISGRYLDSAGNDGPTGTIESRFQPPGGKPEIVVQTSSILNGWFHVFALKGIPLRQVVKEIELDLFGQALSLENHTLLAPSENLLKIYVPVHRRQEGSSSVTESEGQIFAIGYFGPGKAGKKICNSVVTGTPSDKYFNHQLGPANALSPLTYLSQPGPIESEPTTDLSNTVTPDSSIWLQGGLSSADTWCQTSIGQAANQRYSQYLEITTDSLRQGFHQVSGYQGIFAQTSAFFQDGTAEDLSFPSSTSAPFIQVWKSPQWTFAGRILPGVSGVSRVRAYALSSDTSFNNDSIPCSALEQGTQASTPIGDTSLSPSGAFVLATSLTAASVSSGAKVALCLVNATKQDLGVLLHNSQLANAMNSLPMPANLILAGAPLAGDFGQVTSGSTSSRTLTLTNNGNFVAQSITANLPSGFLFAGGTFPGSGGTCSSNLPAGESCNIVLTWSPTSPGLMQTQMVLNYDSGFKPKTSTFDLRGQSTTPALLTLSHSGYDFGTIPTGGTRNISLTVTNSGASPASITTPTISAPLGWTGGSYPGLGGNCTSTLAANSSCLMNVTMTPISPSALSGTVTLSYFNGRISQTVSRTLTGTAVAPANIAISDSPLYTFPTTYTVESSEQTFTLTNSGGYPATMISGAGLDAPFQFSGGSYPGLGGTCAGNLAPGTSCTLRVRFSPMATSTYTDILEIAFNNGVTAQTVTENLSGDGLVPTPPSTPSLTSVSATNPGQLTINWSLSSGSAPINYQLLRSTTSGTGYGVITSGPSMANYVDTTTLPGVTYYYKVRATGPGGNMAESAEVSGKAMSAFTLSSLQSLDHSLAVKFAPSTGATSYNIKYGTVSGYWPNTAGNSAATDFTITGLSIGTTYFVMVEAVNESGIIQATSEINAELIPVPIKISRGSMSEHRCAILSNQQVKCWGHSTYGKLGVPQILTLGHRTGTMGDNLQSASLGTTSLPIQVKSGANFNCAKFANNNLKCWGDNNNGQLGLESTIQRGSQTGNMGDNLPYINFGAGRTVKDFDLGSSHACVILDNDQIKCWGHNAYGQLGQGSITSKGVAANQMGDFLPVTDLGTGFIPSQLAIGAYHSCALSTSGLVKCWGMNTSGQLGLGDITHRGTAASQMGNSLPVVNLGTGRTAVQVAAGGNMTCALLDNQTVKCWGYNFYGQLGLGSTTTKGTASGQMGDALAAVDLPATTAKIFVGGNHTCALGVDGGLRCWGQNSYGQLGAGSTNNLGDGANEINTLAGINLGANIAQILDVALSNTVTCAKLRKTDTSIGLKCWGRGSYGALGYEDIISRGVSSPQMGDSLPWVALGTNESPLAVSISDSETTCAVRFNTATTNQSIACWGQNHHGALAIGSPSDLGDQPGEMGQSLPAIDLGTGFTPADIATGGYHTCVLSTTGQVKCFGYNYAGQLGYGDTVSRGELATSMGTGLTTIDLNGAIATSIVAGSSFTCALLTTGEVKCWGNNTSGQLGIDSTIHKGDNAGEMGASLSSVALGENATQLTAGSDHICARLISGAAKCWGFNLNNQLGYTDSVNRGTSTSPMSGVLALNLGRPVLQIAAGSTSTCALLDDHTVRCWGYNSSGELGRESTVSSANGEALSTLSAVPLGAGLTNDVQKIFAGGSHFCAQFSDQRIKCWGGNNSGQLGIGTSGNKGISAGQMGDALPFVNLPTGAVVTTLSTGNQSTCGLFADSRIRCWGAALNGQLGLENTNSIGLSASGMGNAMATTNLW